MVACAAAVDAGANVVVVVVGAGEVAVADVMECDAVAVRPFVAVEWLQCLDNRRTQDGWGFATAAVVACAADARAVAVADAVTAVAFGICEMV